VIYIAVSIDGFIADEEGSVAFLEAFEKDDYGYDSFLEGIGSIIIGRTTFTQILGFGVWPYGDISSIVWSEREFKELPDKVEVISGSVSQIADRATELAGNKDIWVLGGGKTAQAFMEAGFVDRYELFVIPVTLGKGVRLFEGKASEPYPLKLVNAQPFANGVVQLVYKTV
jgi:dihydrofolate reductase